MRGYLADKFPCEEGYYSELQVLRSAAGYYIGTIFHNTKDGYDEPGSLESGYYPTKESAQEDLDNGGWEQRLWP